MNGNGKLVFSGPFAWRLGDTLPCLSEAPAGASQDDCVRHTARLFDEESVTVSFGCESQPLGVPGALAA